MIQKLVLFTSIFFLTFRATQGASAQWVQTNGPAGGPVQALEVNGTNLYAGIGGGLFLSTNSGTSWTEVDNGLTNTNVMALAMIGTNLFAGTGDGVFRSTDNGTSWTPVGFTSTNVSSFVVSGANLFAVSTYHGAFTSGVFLTTNNGTSWTEVDDGLMGTHVFALTGSGTSLFAGTYKGVFRSTNNGANWTAASAGLPSTSVSAFAVIGSNLFAGTNSNNSSGGVFLSTDSGTSWNAACTGLTNTPVNAFAVSGANLFAGTNGGVFLSTNNGTSWNPEGFSGLSVKVLAVSESTLFVGYDSVWRRPLSEMILSGAVQRTPAIRGEIQSFPNPLTQSTTILLTSSEGGVAIVRIVNLLGTEVSRLFDGQWTEAMSGERHFTWDARGMVPGVYWCEVRMNGHVERTAMVVER